METLKHIGAFLAIAILFGGFAALVVWNIESGKAHCPGYYSASYGCAVPR